MNYGLQISASGVLSSLYRQDVLTNNLANLNTVGFKPSIPSGRFRDPARVEDGLASLPSNTLLERLGAGVTPGENRIGFSQGAINMTGAPLDAAIEGDGFFVVGNGPGDARFTRDGRFTLDRTGRLVHAGVGLPVLDDEGRTIQVPPDGEVAIGRHGRLTVDGRDVATLAIDDVANRAGLRKIGNNLFDISRAGPRQRAQGTVMQGHLESSAVAEIDELIKIQAASRKVGSNISMITYHDRMMERAINTFGRVA